MIIEMDSKRTACNGTTDRESSSERAICQECQTVLIRRPGGPRFDRSDYHALKISRSFVTVRLSETPKMVQKPAQ